MSKVTIVTTTYYPDSAEGKARLEQAVKNCRSWNKNLKGASLCLHVADDGSELPGAMEAWAPARRWYADVSFSRQERCGVGASLNRGMEEAFRQSDGDFALYITDDVELKQVIDLAPLIDVLETVEGMGAIRLGWPHPGIAGRVHHYETASGVAWLLHLSRHDVVASQRPTLYHRRFWSDYGLWPERQNAVECERLYNEAYCRSTKSLIVQAIFDPWQHHRILDLGELQP